MRPSQSINQSINIRIKLGNPDKTLSGFDIIWWDVLTGRFGTSFLVLSKARQALRSPAFVPLSQGAAPRVLAQSFILIQAERISIPPDAAGDSFLPAATAKADALAVRAVIRALPIARSRAGGGARRDRAPW